MMHSNFSKKDMVMAFDILNLSKTYHSCSDTEKCWNIFDMHLQPYNGDYYKPARKFFRYLTDYADKKNMDNNDKIKMIFKKSPQFFKIYHENSMASFKATGFVQNYCQSSLETILEAFMNLNLTKSFVANHNGTEWPLQYDEISKILDMHLIMLLAKIFSTFDQSEKIFNKFGIDADIIFITNGIKKLSKNCEIINKNQLLVKDLTKKQIQNIFGDDDSISIQAIIHFWNKIIKILKNFFSQPDPVLTNYIIKNIDLHSVFAVTMPYGKIYSGYLLNIFLSSTDIFYLVWLIENQNNSTKKFCPKFNTSKNLASHIVTIEI